MTEAEHTLLHMLGMTGRGERQRNHYVGEDAGVRELVAAGLVEQVSKGSTLSGGDPVFRATAAGKAEAARVQARERAAAPKLSRSQLRYREWLHLDLGVSFGDWLRGAR